MNILVFVTLSILSSAACHYFFKTYIVAAVLSAFIASISFQIFAYAVVGYLDPFFIVALLVGWLISFFISLLVGLPFLFERRKTKT